MSERQADALLISQYDIIEKYVNVDEIAYAKGVSAETIRTGQLYNRGLTLIADCLTVCGLKKHIVCDLCFELRFDCNNSINSTSIFLHFFYLTALQHI